jgi:hypothetical protein
MNGGIQIATLIVIAITIGVMVFTVDVIIGGGIFL